VAAKARTRVLKANGWMVFILFLSGNHGVGSMSRAARSDGADAFKVNAQGRAHAVRGCGEFHNE